MVQQTVAKNNSILFCFKFQVSYIVIDFVWQDTIIAHRDAHEDLVQENYWVDARTTILKNVIQVPAPNLQVILESRMWDV